jgi:DNA-directed RNA polymerase subunit RPC12/RpoP
MATRPATDLRIQFICSHCGKALKAEPQKVGKRALCTGCGRGVLVPGLAEPPPKPAVDIADLPSSRPPLDEVAPEEVAEAAKTGGGDASAGPASLYLGGVNFVLFLSLAIMAGLLFSFGTVGLAILGVLALSGLVLSWRGWRLAREAMEVAAATGQGRGHAIAAGATA